ncbi:MAG: hypothetical protein EFT35_01160 [Methanophagales archaeon ANME-1-THS]|nr:MAG: hypothetical protein EFT35_01160 [Methanophagales archaeon ANME-1-THS]
MIETIKQDVLVAIEALKRDNFDLVNIAGNRIATDSMIIKRNDLIMVGFLLKEVSIEIRRVKEVNERNLIRCRETGRKFLEGLLSLLDEEIATKEIWERYQNYKREIKSYLLIDIESSLYKENPGFTKETRTMLLEQLNGNKRLLTKRDYRLVEGIASEISRVINAYGFYPEDLVFYLVMKVFSSYYDYFIYDYYLEESNEEKTKKEKELNSYIDKIYELFSAGNNLNELYEVSAKIIGELGARWRMYFINLGEIRMIVERRVELPPEAKKEIEEGIAEVFERKIREGK